MMRSLTFDRSLNFSLRLDLVEFDVELEYVKFALNYEDCSSLYRILIGVSLGGGTLWSNL